MKKGIAVILLSLLMVTTILSGSSLATQGTQSKVLTMEEVVKATLQNNNQIKMEALRVEQTELDAKHTKSELRKIDLKTIQMFAGNKTIANVEVQVEIGNLKADYSVEAAKDKKDMLEQQIVLLAKEAYYKAIEVEKSLQLTEDNLNYLKKQMNSLIIQKNLGNATELEILNLQIQITKAENQLQQIKNNKKIAHMNLNKSLGNPLDTPLTLQENVVDIKFEGDLEKVIEIAIQSRIDMKGMKKDLEFKKKEFDIYKSYLSSGHYERDKALSVYELAEAALNDKKQDIEIEVTNKYYNVLDRKNQIKAAEANIKKAEKDLEVIKLKHENGLATFTQVLEVQNILTNERLNYISAVHSGYMDIERFNFAVNYGSM